MKSLKPLKQIYHTDYNDTTDFATKARLLQSIWRSEKNYDYENYGNFLQKDFARNTGANFLTRNIFEIVKNEVKNKHKNGKVIQEPRIWNNLLSSQPMAFNLFGELKSNLKTATLVFQKIYPERQIDRIEDIEFEYSPGRKNLKYTGDSSAFDIFIKYLTYKHEKGFFGIEIKYAEDLNDPPATHKEKYEIIAKESGIFDMSKIEELKEKPLQQIWRDHLLSVLVVT